jgi:hypothetical protein
LVRSSIDLGPKSGPPSWVDREGQRDLFLRRSRSDSLWQDCGRNKWKVTGNGWDEMSMDAKTLDFARGCNSIQIIG